MMRTPAEIQKYQSKKAWEHHKKMESIKLQQDALELHGFDVEILAEYPHKLRAGDVPLFLLEDQIKKINGYEDIQKRIQEEFDKPHLLPTKDHVQLAYERFCQRFNTAPLTVLQFFHDGVLCYQNYSLDLAQVKAICCTIPLIKGLKHVQFIDNNLSDEMSAIVVMAAYMHPTVDSITISRNSLQKTACRTLRQLQVPCPSKMKRLDLDGSADISHHLESILSDMGNAEFLKTQTFRPG